MVNLDLLQNVLKNTSSSEDTPDDSFDQVVSFIENEKIEEAAGVIEKTFAKGIPDIRLIVYYFYAHFVDRGIKAFADIFPSIVTLVNEHWEILKPQDRKDKYLQSSLNWFFSHILNKLKYSEKLHKAGKIHPLWKKSVQEVTPEELENLIAIARDFQNFFFKKWPTSLVKERVVHLVKKIEELRSLIKEEKKSETPKESEVEKPQAKEQPKVEIPVEAVVSHPEEIIYTSEPEPIMEHFSEEISEPFQVKQEIPPTAIPNPTNNEEKLLFLEKLEGFSQKLALFELFISQNDYLKAAVVARDIDRLIESFDPLSYFPKLFAKYFSLVAKHVAALSDQFEKKETLQVKSLEKLYRTDLDMFVDW